MKTASFSLSETWQLRLAPALLLPSVVSLFGALLAWAMAAADWRSTWPLTFITGLQATLLLSGAAFVAGQHDAMQDCWQRRVAPSSALRRVRRAFLALLAHLAARAVVGPLLMVAALAWLQPGWDLLLRAAAVLLVLASMLLVGALLGTRLQGRVSAWMAAGRRPLSVRAWLLKGGPRRWRRVWTVQEAYLTKRSGGLLIWLTLIPQTLIQAPRWRFHAWGKTLTSGWDIVWVGLWMLMLCLYINAATIGPPLHWRVRLAPGGLSASAWARRMVAGSMLSAMACVSAALALSMAVSDPDLRAVQLTAWAPVMADTLLAVTCALWLRGQRNDNARVLWAGVGLGLGTWLLLGAARAFGFTPQRGVALLAAELALALAFAVAAQRGWARQDLNRLVPRA